ncbi:hypothetical protein CPB84DRAFT_1690343 [Gymnopilus junonius]|uniref:Uncharacterized protein n=1 Tax=Gymnopilus junonius TaxID=109634 RepID=A0A9P5N882_GYMJU|nr:hypothetical protein CPB84DRAFT_1690343 [Gymnopilus junonius]
MDEFRDSDDDDFDLAEEVRQYLATDVQDSEEVARQFNDLPVDSDYFPYPSKLMMLLDIVDNLPRLRMSANLFRMVLWILKEVGVPNVPSYDAFHKLQTDLRKTCGTNPTKHESMLGNIFYLNSLEDSIARNFANPEIAKHINPYPEEPEGPISEGWQTGRWKEFKPSELTPMYARGLRQFYIEEVSAIDSGEYVIPHDWVIRKKELTASCSIVQVTPHGWRINHNDRRIIKASQFKRNYHDIIAERGAEIQWADDVQALEMPNPLCKIAKDKDLFVIMMPLWCDDVSGNKSKQYNKHINMYAVNGNLPGRLLQQEYFIQYVSASPHATAPEQFVTLKERINKTHMEPIECYNASTGREACVMIHVPGLPADNPQQSEEASHMGGNANLKCRRCGVGGPHDHTESDEGYHSLHFTGVARSAGETQKCLEKQLKTACYGIEKHVTDIQTETGTKDKITQHWIDILIQKCHEMKSQDPGWTPDSIAEELQKWLKDQPGDKFNPLLSIAGLDPTRDTPVEILHTILLGIVKYVWHLINVSWTDANRATFAIRLQSTDLDGLTVPPLRADYMIQYRNNLIGKHFKTLMQMIAFHVHDLITPAEFTLIKAVGALGAVLWVHEIEDMDEYLKDLEILIGNVLDAFGDVDPAKIIVKMKLHILTHLPEDIRRFGPAIRNSTEIFECFNGVFRLCSIYSNHQAPSRDIATKFASMDRVKHILSGGYWKQGDDWVHAGSGVLRVLKSEAIIQRHLGWVPQSEIIPGAMRLAGKAKNAVMSWSDTLVSKVLSSTASINTQVSWRKGVSVIAKSGDKCGIGSWIFYQFLGTTSIGRIAEIICPESELTSPESGLITVEVFSLSGEQHPDFDLPFLRQPQNAQKHQVIKPLDVLFIFSVQHDCRTAKCEPANFRIQLQERQATTRQESLIKHKNDGHYLINTYAIHNATLLRQAIPRHLTTPKKLYEDRKAHHAAIATTLRVNQAAKRAKTQAKRKATLEANKAKKQQRAEAQIDSEDEGIESEEEMGIGEGDRPTKR